MLLFLLAFNFSVIPQGGIDMYNNIYMLSPTENYKVGFTSELIFLNTIIIGGNLDVYMDPDFDSFEPKILDSMFWIKIDFDWVNFQFIHRCSHPIVCWAISDKFQRNFESWYREIKVEFVSKNVIIK